MAMDEFAQLYGKVRAATLARHFAVNERFRANFLLSSSGLETDLSRMELLNIPPEQQQRERWRAGSRGGDNPLMASGKLMTCLAVEYHLGRQEALPLLRALLETIGSLYKFSDDHFAGYILRWDPVLAYQGWVEDAQRRYNATFYLHQDLTYNYCTPLHDPRSRQPTDWDWNDRFRRWEPSMDELVGLVMGYDMIFNLVDVADVKSEVRRQVNNLGDYLAEHGYYLVRPGGGFTARGAAGILVALEYPFSCVFQRITGDPYYIRNGFQAVMEKADVWKGLEAPFYKWAAVGFAVAPLLVPFMNEVMAPMGLGFLIGVTGPLTGAQLGEIFAIWAHRDLFDVWRGAEEFAMAYALSLLSLRRRFDDYANGAQGAARGNPAVSFLPYLGVTGLRHPNDTQWEPNIRQAYLNWLPARRSAGLPEVPEMRCVGFPFDPDIDIDTFSTAVAVALDAGEAEDQRLVGLLRRLRDAYPDPALRVKYPDLPLFDNTLNPARDCQPRPEVTRDQIETYEVDGLSYMTSLALAWLHRKRRQDAGSRVTTPGFPALPDWNDRQSPWPLAAVPPEVLREARAGTLALPLNAIQRSTPLHLTPEGAADLFYDDPPVPRSPIPPVLLPDPPRTLALSEEFTVPESARDVQTGIVLRMGDAFEIEASGRIWAGVFLTGENGPNGWEDRIEYDRKFPLTGRPNGHPFSLIGKLGGGGAYFFIGEHRPRERYLGEEDRELFLRINDDSPGNGSGAFTCRVRVWGAPLEIGSQISCITRDRNDPDRRIDALGGVHEDGTRWSLPLDQAIALVEEGHHFFVERPEGDHVRIIAATRRGKKYLKTVADGDEPNNLLALPECP